MSLTTNDSVTIAVAGVTRRGRPRRPHTCKYCDKVFKRGEHCRRHERTHTQEKPFVCQYCRKSYSRKDLVTRHERTIHAQAHHQSRDRDSERGLDSVVAAASQQRPTVRPRIYLGTPPGDGSGGRDQEHVQADRVSGQEPSPGNSSLLNNDLTLSLSPSTSSSSNEPPHRASSGSVRAAGAAANNNDSEIGIALIPHPQAYGDATDAAAFDRGEYSSLLIGYTPTSSAQFLPSSRHVDLNHSYATSNLGAFDPTDSQAPPPDKTPADLDMEMAVAVDLPPLDEVEDSSGTRHQQHHYLSQSSARLGQDSTHLSFSPMPTTDIDLSAFVSSLLQNQPADVHLDQLMSQTTEDLGLRNPLLGDMQLMSNLDISSQMHPPLGTLDKHLGTSPTLKSHGNGHGLPILKEQRQSYPIMTLDDVAYQSLRSDVAQRLARPDPDIKLPPVKICQSFLSSYVTSFHNHFPIIHLRSLCLRTTPSPLILAMCSIGALYRLDRRQARRLYELAVHALESTPPPTLNGHATLVKGYSLWHAQARILLMFQAVMSGEKDLLMSTLHRSGFFSLLYNNARIALTSTNVNPSHLGWEKWIERESWKRMLGGLLIASTLMMVLFDLNPGFNSTQDLEFEPFEDEAIWNAASPDEWRDLRTSSLKQKQGQRHHTMKDVLMDIMMEGKGDADRTLYRVSAFSAVVLMHGVVVHMWQSLQVSQAFTVPSGYSSVLTATNCETLGDSLLNSAMQTLRRCEIFLGSPDSETNPLDPADEETSLVFNSKAILRIAYIRLFKFINPSSRFNIVTMDADEMDEAISSFVAAKLERGPHLIDAVAKCFEGLRIPIMLGHMLVRKTAAFRWSVEHAIAGWESALLITKWIDSVENDHPTRPSPEELELLGLIEDILKEAECDVGEGDSLAAAAARTWGLFLQDVWVWGITQRMGTALELLAQAYERLGRANRRTALRASTLLSGNRRE